LYVSNQPSFTTIPTSRSLDSVIQSFVDEPDPFLAADLRNVRRNERLVSALPLCAKARQERSGVQLI
jgi:hypothetical protein